MNTDQKKMLDSLMVDYGLTVKALHGRDDYHIAVTVRAALKEAFERGQKSTQD